MIINKKEVLRYLGYRNQEISDELDAFIDLCIAECERTARPGSVYRIFDIVRTNGGIDLAGTAVTLKGSSITAHLKSCTKCALMAATLGAGIDNLIYTAQRLNITKALILDACASDMVERVCNDLNRQITREAAKFGFKTNYRFSPGYGDLALETQPEILSLLDAQRAIGLTCTADFLMTPRKSVTAVIGFITDSDNQFEPKGDANGF